MELQVNPTPPPTPTKEYVYFSLIQRCWETKPGREGGHIEDWTSYAKINFWKALEDLRFDSLKNSILMPYTGNVIPCSSIPFLLPLNLVHFSLIVAVMLFAEKREPFLHVFVYADYVQPSMRHHP